MDRLVRLRIGGGKVHSGLLPVDALQLVKDLIAGLREHGGDPEVWDNANVHIQVVGASSTEALIMSEFTPALRPAVATFRKRAAANTLSGKSSDFVERNFKPSSTWLYLELLPDNGDAPVRFDHEYRDRLLARAPAPVRGEESFYARVIRAGGENPPTVKVDIMGHGTRTIKLTGQDGHDLAKKLGEKLYETVNLIGTATWDRQTYKLIDFASVTLNEEWEDVALADVIRQGGGILPVELTVEGEGELIEAREQGRKPS